METKRKNILIVMNFCAVHSGNAINSLLDLDEYDTSNNYFFAFPISAKKCDWTNKFNKNIYFLSYPTKNKYFLNKDVLGELDDIIKKNNIDLIHSHFDGYDIACSKACKKNHIPFVISFRDPVVKLKNPIKNMYQEIMLQIHYRIYARKAKIIFVNKDLEKLHKRLGIKNFSCINNGLSFSRIQPKFKNIESLPIRFFYLGGDRFHVKGVDTLMNYLNENADLNLIVTIYCSNNVAKEIQKYNDNRVIIKERYEDFNQVINENDFFVTFSRYETFHNAIAESVYGGLPVIKTRCEGNDWANKINTVSVIDSSCEFKDAINKVIKIDIQQKENASKYIKDNYGIKKWCNEIIDIYKEMFYK